MNDLLQMWQAALAEIEATVSQANFSTWFKETHILKHEEGTIYVGVPNSFIQEWLQKKFHSHILNVLKKLDSTIVALQYVIVDKDGKPKPIPSPFIMGPFDGFGDCLDVDAEIIKDEFVECLKELRDQAVEELKAFISDEMKKMSAEIVAAIKAA